MLDKLLWSMRRLGRHRLAREAVRRAFRIPFPHGSVRRIPTGPLKGMRWYCHREHQFWMPLGAYEDETARWLELNLGPGMTFFDVGANAGYFSLLGARRVGPTGRVVAFEPVPENVEVVRRQLELNGLAQASVEALAVSDAPGEATFVIDSVNANSHLGEVDTGQGRGHAMRTFTVETTSLDAWCAEHALVPDVMKIDVEGAELQVLAGGERLLSETRPRCIVSTHSDALREGTQAALEQHGYQVVALPGFGHELLGYPR